MKVFGSNLAGIIRHENEITSAIDTGFLPIFKAYKRVYSKLDHAEYARKNQPITKVIKFAFLSICVAQQVNAAEKEEQIQLETINVIADTPIQGSQVEKNKIPTHVQVVNAHELQNAQSLTVSDYMNRYLGSVNINDAQNNPYQPNVQYRGFAASPLMGLPQGLAVYVNGIRFNEAFGDMVNWDLIPEGAIDTMTVQSGSNPTFGLNSLGGALALKTKTGFSAPKHEFEVSGGSWGRHAEELSSGWNNGTIGYFFDAKYFNEDGWRPFSNSEVKQGIGTFSWRSKRSDLDLTLASADTKLRGNGTLPQELLILDRSSIYTHPDITRNQMFLASLNGSSDVNNYLNLAGNMYFRRNAMSSYNADGNDFGSCANHGTDVLCNDDGQLLSDVNGQQIPFADNLTGGTINTAQTIQRAFGFALQTAFNKAILGHANHFVVGSTYDNNTVHFSSDTEAGSLTADRGVTGSGVFLDDSKVRLHTATQTWGAFFSDNFSITKKLGLTVAGRYNTSDIELKDQYGTALNGKHHYERFNPSAGLTYALTPQFTAYGNYSESTRMPTPMELSCADPNDPCKLPNAFVSDPPLKQVVAETFEAGFRGHFVGLPESTIDWNAGVFQTLSNDDIIFQSAGGARANRGYFSNVGRTRRQGIELGLQASVYDRLRITSNYTYLSAEFRTAFQSHSPNHPNADEFGNIAVQPGNQIPGIPEHLVKFAVDYDILKSWTMGINMIYNGQQFLRGDESNQTSQIGSYVLFNLKSEYRFNEHVALFGKLDNVLNQHYQNFGTFGNTGTVLESTLGANANDQNTRFYGVGAPRAGWVGIRLTL